MLRISLTTALATVVSIAAMSAAHAACFTRPGTPVNTKAELVRGNERDTIRYSWFDTTRADERVWHDIEVTDRNGRAVPSLSLTDVGYGAMSGKNQTTRDFGGLAPNTTLCFRVKARTEAGTNGCVSKLWSGRVCATTASAPAQGRWGALSADGRGHWGYAVNYATEAQARAAAQKGCGDRRCKVAISGAVSCYAYFESRSNGYWYGLALHSSGATATDVARKGCESGAPAGTCKLVKASCG